ncbi:hypothetical protein E2C01_077482 [Portunus trituberculatus]|uniref:Uncharacterized protein n=1 Tax=Portunus trituberculatus TaxID=210409 RepID=A0A5B7ILI1_PORTR|nr:hypothetical protein [Portunus trituberculatus]
MRSRGGDERRMRKVIGEEYIMVGNYDDDGSTVIIFLAPNGSFLALCNLAIINHTSDRRLMNVKRKKEETERKKGCPVNVLIVGTAWDKIRAFSLAIVRKIII